MTGLPNQRQLVEEEEQARKGLWDTWTRYMTERQHSEDAQRHCDEALRHYIDLWLESPALVTRLRETEETYAQACKRLDYLIAFEYKSPWDLLSMAVTTELQKLNGDTAETGDAKRRFACNRPVFAWQQLLLLPFFACLIGTRKLINITITQYRKDASRECNPATSRPCLGCSVLVIATGEPELNASCLGGARAHDNALLKKVYCQLKLAFNLRVRGFIGYIGYKTSGY